MIIPVRCFNCGQVLGSKYKKYKELINAPVLVKMEDEHGFFVVASTSLETWNKEDEITLKDRNAFIASTLAHIEQEHQQKERNRELLRNNTGVGGGVEDSESTGEITTLSDQVIDGTKNIEAIILDQVGLKRYCCRTHMVSHVQII